MPKKERLNADEVEYIRANCMSTSDEKLSKTLNRHIRTVINCRKKLGIQKRVGGGIKDVNLARNLVTGTTVVKAHQGMDEDTRKEFYKTQFTNSLYYKNLKEQFTKDEIGFYLEEWAGLCVQFEDIVATEKRQIDSYIKLRILGNRILKYIFTIENEIVLLQKEVELFRKTHDLQADEIAQERDRTLMDMIGSMNAQAKSIRIDHQKNVELESKLLDELNGRRKDRVDQLSKRGTTFLGLLQDFRDRQTREKQGKHMELMRLAKEKKKEDWRRPHRFPDGTEDPILLDEGTTFPKKEMVVMGNDCKSIDECLKNPNAKILIIDDESRRQQFFGDVFNGYEIDYASNLYKATESIKTKDYDLICFDYDLGLGTKGTEIAEKLIEDKLSNNSRLLIHSMNKEGAKKIAEKLSSRETEIYPFEDIVKNLGEKYAKNHNSIRAVESDPIDDREG